MSSRPALRNSSRGSARTRPKSLSESIAEVRCYREPLLRRPAEVAIVSHSWTHTDVLRTVDGNARATVQVPEEVVPLERMPQVILTAPESRTSRARKQLDAPAGDRHYPAKSERHQGNPLVSG